MDFKKNFKFIKDLSWDQVFDIWHQIEKDNPEWEKLYKSRGFDNWYDWRMTYAKPLQLDKLEWNLYKINKPSEIIPNFYGGPFTVWKKYYYGEHDSLQYKDLLVDEVLNRVNSKVRRLVNKFPEETYLLGIIIKNKIIIVEGTHRCLAVSLMAKEGKKINTNINICLAKSILEELPIVGGTK